MDITVPGFTRFSRFGVNLGRLHPIAAIHTEALDGTDELQITCLDELSKNDYIVWQDRDNKWHEHIVNSVKRGHDNTGEPLTLASCINSIAETWDDYVEDRRPTGSVTVALSAILEASRWVAGTCTQTGTATHTFYHKSVRECISEVLETWGGELETQLTVTAAGVTQRKVAVLSQRGNQDSAKRFTWTKDIVSITRELLEENPKSRIYAYGKGVETESGGYGRRLGISEVNGGLPYVEDTNATQQFGHPMRDGTIAPAVGIYINDQCEDANQLLAEARAALADAIVPKVAYTADVIDLVAFGRTWEGVGLGDVVTIVDKEFSDEGLRLKGRVSKLERDLMTYDTTVTFGTLFDALTSPWKSLQERVSSLSQRSVNWDLAGTASTGWLDTLMASMNAAFEAVGTYRYSSFEKGDIWASVPLDADGNATTSGGWAININGAGFRIASSLNPDGTWNWRTFGTGNGFTADEIVAGTLKAGTIQDATGANYWILDTGEMLFSDALNIQVTCNLIDGTSSTYKYTGIAKIGVLHDNVSSAMFQNLIGTNVASNSYSIPGLKISAQSSSGNEVGYLQILPPLYGSYMRASLFSEKPIYLFSSITNTENGAGIYTSESATALKGRGQTDVTVLNSDSSESIRIRTRTLLVTGAIDYISYTSGSYEMQVGANSTAYTTKIPSKASFTRAVTMSGSLTVSGSKNRLVETENYDDRLLYAYESAAPLFGDVGSGVLDDEGMCVVAIDDVLTECARTDMGYQVFLQKCGEGDVWVDEKTPAYFVVKGTAGLAFDWEVKAHQKGYEQDRLEDVVKRDESDFEGEELFDPYEINPYTQEEIDEEDELESQYYEDLAFIELMESLYYETEAA